MAKQKVRLRDHPARPVGSLLAVSLCLALGLLLVTTGAALGISGFASDEPAVRAQYPDQNLGQSPTAVVSSLGDVIRTTREAERDPKVAARWRASQQEITRSVTGALASVAGLDARQSGSIALLVAGIAVLSVGGVLRWRRGLTPI